MSNATITTLPTNIRRLHKTLPVDEYSNRDTFNTNPNTGDHGDHDADATVIDLNVEPLASIDAEEATEVIDLTDADVDQPGVYPASTASPTNHNDATQRMARPTEAAPLRRPSPRRGGTSRPRLGTVGRAGAIELRSHNKTRRYQRLEAVFSWAEAAGRSVHTDALLMIVECEADFATWPPDCWTEHGLWQFLWSEVNTACVLAGRTEPRGMAETMWLYLDYLSQTIGLAAGSDPIEKLQGFLMEYGDLTDSGRPRNPDGSGPSPSQFSFDLEPAA